jgi:hypothetical protein
MMMRRSWFAVAFLFVTLLAANAMPNPVRAQVVNPADTHGEEGTATTREPDQRHTYQLPAIDVHGRRPSHFREEDRIGANAQPRWTAVRRFTETRVYVLTEGQIEFEYWLVPSFNRDNSTEVKKQYEVEMGLPCRFQLDLYVVSHQDGNEGLLAFDEEKFELRWALAKWGRIPCNPTLYAEWAAVSSAPDHFEGKLLLGEEIAPGWHWGANLVFEHEMGGEQENSKEITSGLAYSLVDEKLSLGVEEKFARVDTIRNRGKGSRELLLGPSLQVRPLPQMHVDLTGLIGVRQDAPKAEPMLVVGWEF